MKIRALAVLAVSFLLFSGCDLLFPPEVVPDYVGTWEAGPIGSGPPYMTLIFESDSLEQRFYNDAARDDLAGVQRWSVAVSGTEMTWTPVSGWDPSMDADGDGQADESEFGPAPASASQYSGEYTVSGDTLTLGSGSAALVLTRA